MMTNLVQFPRLGLELEIDRVAFSLGSLNIYWYGLIIATGLLAGFLIAYAKAKKFGIDSDRMTDVILVTTVLAVLCARIYYVVFYPGDYDTLGKILNLRDGGLAIYGAVLGAFFFGWLMCRLRRVPVLAMFDLTAIGFLAGQAIGRWGNFMNREAFGSETTCLFRMQLTTKAGQLIEVHPTFLYESVWNLVGLLLLLFVVSKHRKFDGENTWFYFLWYGVGRFWVEGLRTDSLYLFNWQLFGQPIRVSQALSAVMVLVSIFMLVWNLKVHPHKPEELYVNQVAAREQAEQNEKAQEE